MWQQQQQQQQQDDDRTAYCLLGYKKQFVCVTLDNNA